MGRVFKLFCGAGLLILSGCSQPSDVAEPTVGSSTYDLRLSVKELMNYTLEPASEVLWDSAGSIVTYDGEQSLAPTTPEGWEQVLVAGATVIELGNALQLPERAAGRADWVQFAAAVSHYGGVAIVAAENQDEPALFQAGADLYSMCVACHQVYAPGIKRVD